MVTNMKNKYVIFLLKIDKINMNNISNNKNNNKMRANPFDWLYLYRKNDSNFQSYHD